jgi:hypothetical protein
MKMTNLKLSMGIKSQLKIAKRGRNNRRLMYRKIVAAVSHRTIGIPIREIAGYLNVDSSAVSKMLDEGERLAMKMKKKYLSNAINHLHPYIPFLYTPGMYIVTIATLEKRRLFRPVLIK